MSRAHLAMSTHVLKAPQAFRSTHPFSCSQLSDANARPFAEREMERERERALQKGRETPHAQIGVEPQFAHAISASSAERTRRTGVPAASVSSIAAATAPSTVAATAATTVARAATTVATAATTAPVTRISMRANARLARPLSFASPPPPASEGAIRADVVDQEVVNDSTGADSLRRTPPARSASPRIGRDERARTGAKGGGPSGGPSGAQRYSVSDARTLETQRTMARQWEQMPMTRQCSQRTMTRQWEQMLSDDSVDRFSSCICTQKRTHMHPSIVPAVMCACLYVCR